MKIKKFRNALGTFTTGITIVTTLDEEGNPYGITVNSFASVSLEPPLVLWSIGRDSDHHEIFEQTDYFAIHVLHEKQQALSEHFATTKVDKFSDLSWQKGEYGSPILEEYGSCFQCRTEDRYAGGDHTIIVGHVEIFHTQNKCQPLVFHKGQYQKLT